MPSNLEVSFNKTDAAELLKTVFTEYQKAVYNEDILLWSQLKTRPYEGKGVEFPAPFNYSGGVGSGSLPKKRAADYRTVTITNVKTYSLADVEREALAVSMKDRGSFVRFMEEPMKKIRESFVWNMERMMHGTSDGKLGTIASGGVTDNGGGNYTLVLDTPKMANFEEGMLVNIETANTDLFEITVVDPDTSSITVQREAGGVQVPAQTDEIFMQGSEDNDTVGLEDAISKTSGNLYGISTTLRKWHSYRENGASKAITPQLLTKVVLRQEKRVGKKKGINFGLASYIQYEKLLNQLEDSKMYDTIKVGPKDKSLKAHISWDGIVVHTTGGPVQLFPDRFVPDAQIWLMNIDECAKYEAPKSGFVDEDGSPWHRSDDEDQFELRWAWYGQMYFPPIYLAQIHSLSTT